MAETPGDVETVIASGVGSKTVIARSEATLTVIASEAKQSISPRKERVDCFVACAPRNDGHDFRSPCHRPYCFTFQTARRVPTRLRDLAAGFARGLPRTSRLLKFRGRRECRALDAPAASCVKKQTHERSHHGHTGNHPAFPAQWFTAYFALSPVTRLV